MGAHRLWCLAALLLLHNSDARTVKLVPAETKTITTNGETHEISRYILVPDEESSPNTASNEHQLEIADKNGVAKDLNESVIARSGGIDVNDVNDTTNAKISGTKNLNKSTVENIVKYLKSLRNTQAEHTDADNSNGVGQIESEASKAAESPDTVDNHFVVESHSHSYNNNNSTEDFENWHNVENDAEGSVKHTRVTIKFKPKHENSEVLNMNSRNGEEKDEVNLSKNALNMVYYQNSQLAHTVPIPVSDLNVDEDTSKDESDVEKSADDSNKSKQKIIKSHTKITNINYSDLPINWDRKESEDKEHPLLASIEFNKTFTLPGKRGKFKLIYEDDDDNEHIDGVHKKRKQSSPRHQTVTHYYSTKHSVTHSGRNIHDGVHNKKDSDLGLHETVSKSGHGFSSSLDESSLETDTEKRNWININTNDSNDDYTLQNAEDNDLDNTKTENENSEDLIIKNTHSKISSPSDKTIITNRINSEHSNAGAIKLQTQAPNHEEEHTLSLNTFYSDERNQNINPDTEVSHLVTKTSNEEHRLNDLDMVSVHKDFSIPTLHKIKDSNLVTNTHNPEFDLEHSSSALKSKLIIKEPPNEHDLEMTSSVTYIENNNENSETSAQIARERDESRNQTTNYKIIKSAEMSQSIPNKLEVLPLTDIIHNRDYSHVHNTDNPNDTIIKSTSVTHNTYVPPSSDLAITITPYKGLPISDPIDTKHNTASNVDTVRTITNIATEFDNKNEYEWVTVPIEEKISNVVKSEPVTDDVTVYSPEVNDDKVTIPKSNIEDVNQIELSPVVEKTSDEITARNTDVATKYFSEILENNNKDIIPNISIEEIKEIEIDPTVEERSNIDKSEESRPDIAAAYSSEILENDNNESVPNISIEDFNEIHNIPIVEETSDGVESDESRTGVESEHSSEVNNDKVMVIPKTEVENEVEIETVPTVARTSNSGEIEPLVDDTIVHLTKVFKTDNKLSVPKTNHRNFDTIEKNINENMFVLDLEKNQDAPANDFYFLITKPDNDHLTTEPTQNNVNVINYLGAQNKHHKLHAKNTKPADINNLITKTVDDTVVTDYLPNSKNEYPIILKVDGHNNNPDSMLKTNSVKVDSIPDVHSAGIISHPTFEDQDKKTIDLPENHIIISNRKGSKIDNPDSSTNTLLGENAMNNQRQLTPEEVKLLEEKHDHFQKNTESTRKLNNPTPEPDNTSLAFRFGKHIARLPSKTEQIEQHPIQTKPAKVLLESKAMPFYQKYGNDKHKVVLKANVVHPLKEDDSRSAPTYRIDLTHRGDYNKPTVNLAPKIQQRGPINSDHDVARNAYTAKMYRYPQVYPHQIELVPNFENVKIYTPNSNDQYLQHILNYLTSNNFMLSLERKYATEYGVDRDTTRLAYIVEHLQNLGIYHRISQEQLKYLAQKVHQQEMVNNKKKENNKIEIIINNQPAVPNEFGIPNEFGVPNQPTVPNEFDISNKFIIPHQYVVHNQVPNQIYPIRPNWYPGIPNQIQEDANLKEYLLEDFDVNAVDTALGKLGSRVLNIIAYLRTLGVTESMIVQFINETKKHLNNEVIQSLKTDCQTKVYTGLGDKIDLIARQVLQRCTNCMRPRYVAPYNYF